jgi:hypothetical protein
VSNLGVVDAAKLLENPEFGKERAYEPGLLGFG